MIDKNCKVCNGTGRFVAMDGDEYDCYRCAKLLTDVEYIQELRKQNSELSEVLEQMLKNEERRILLHSLSITSPIMMWSKDVNGRYTYMNQALCDHLYFGNPDELIGLDDMEIIQKHLEEWPKHNFGALCMNTDQLTLEMDEENLPTKWYEWGVVRDTWQNVIAWKNKYYDKDGEVLGTVGLAYYVTDEVNEIKDIMDSCKDFDTVKKLNKYLERFGYGQENTKTFNEIIGKE
jgi:PAS domain-containing protein